MTYQPVSARVRSDDVVAAEATVDDTGLPVLSTLPPFELVAVNQASGMPRRVPLR